MAQRNMLNDRVVSADTDYYGNYRRSSIREKENYGLQDYKIDSKVLEIKNRYKDKITSETMPLKDKYNYVPLNSGRRNETQVLKKLQTLKYELQNIPNWQQYARSVLFNEQTNAQSIRHHEDQFLRKNDSFNQTNYLHEQYSRDHKQEKSKDFGHTSTDLNSFRAKQTTSIQKQSGKQSAKKVQFKEELNTYTPSKDIIINKFDLGKTRDQHYRRPSTNLQSRHDKVQNVDKKINEIERKIRQSELKKKMLGVDFIPFEKKYTNMKKCSNFQSHYRSKTPDGVLEGCENSIQINHTRHERQSRHNSVVRQFKNDSSILIDKSFLDLTSPRFAVLENQKSHIEKVELPKQRKFTQHQYSKKYKKNGIDLRKQKANSKLQDFHIQSRYQRMGKGKQQQSPINNKIIWEKTQQGMKERRKRIIGQNELKRKKQNTARLVHAFCEQVKLDEKFRNSKLWFKYCKNEKKLMRLKSLLDIEGFNFSLKKIEEEFEVQEKEDNPFFSVSAQDYDIEDVATSYVESEKYWKKNICKKFNRRALEEEDLNNLTLDLDRKGYIVLEDLVRFLNMETGTFFRNRDLIAIFRRICGKNNKVSFNEFLNIFCG